MDAEFPTLETQRLSLSIPKVDDLARILQLVNNPKIADMTLNIPYPYAEKDAVFWINMANQGAINKDKYIFAIRKKIDKLFMGGIGLHINKRFKHAELGYWIGETFWNQGFVTEALAGILDFGFNQLHLHKIFATHLIENPASGKVMIKNGMIKEAELVDHVCKGKQFKSLIQYRLTKEEYLAVGRS